MSNRLLLATLAILPLCSILSCGNASDLPAFDPEHLAALHEVIRPCEGEDAFDKIAWLTTIHEARVKAAKEGKPILLWEMDGHPLGCG